jgi:hypothetical protein
VANSRPGTSEPVSTVRAKRYWASLLMPVTRPVWAVRIGSNQALSTKTSTVSSEQPVLSPPITPPRPIGRLPSASAMTLISGVMS